MDKISIPDVRHGGEIYSLVLLMAVSVTCFLILIVSVIGAIQNWG